MLAPTTPDRRAVEIREFGSWPDLREELERMSSGNWVFRGQENATWELTSTLYRQLKGRRIKPWLWNEQERRIIRIFCRKAHLYLPTLPGDLLEWLALMQHHGAPTRLLDFTWSPHVAAFFALDSATSDSAIWAVDADLLNQDKEEALKMSDKLLPPTRGASVPDPLVELLFGAHRVRKAFVGGPFVMNRRLTAQSGTFLVPTVADVPLEQLLLEREDTTRGILKLRIRTSQVRREAMGHLYRMNLTNATLFPDLDGLARSMNQELEVNWSQDAGLEDSSESAPPAPPSPSS